MSTTIILFVTCNLVFAKKKRTAVGEDDGGPLQVDLFLFI